MRIARSGDDYCGYVAGYVEHFYFSRRWQALEHSWFVREGTPFRAKIAMMLMRGMMKWAIEDMGAVLLQTGDIAGINSVGVDALYRKMGFQRYGSVYKYESKG
jgi:hypothetical protein